MKRHLDFYVDEGPVEGLRVISTRYVANRDKAVDVGNGFIFCPLFGSPIEGILYLSSCGMDFMICNRGGIGTRIEVAREVVETMRECIENNIALELL